MVCLLLRIVLAVFTYRISVRIMYPTSINSLEVASIEFCIQSSYRIADVFFVGGGNFCVFCSHDNIPTKIEHMIDHIVHSMCVYKGNKDN